MPSRRAVVVALAVACLAIAFLTPYDFDQSGQHAVPPSGVPLSVVCTSNVAAHHRALPIFSVPNSTGMWVVCANTGADAVCDHIASHGSWEPNVYNELRSWLGRIRTAHPERPVKFIDVGSNVGIHAFTMAPHVDAVLAIEAMPQNFAALQEAWCLNKHSNNNVQRLTLTHAAVGSGQFNGTCPIVSHDTNKNDGVMRCDLRMATVQPVGTDIGGGYIIRSVVEMTTIDAVISRDPSWESFVYIMKIDIEGSELEAARGASKFYRGPHAPEVIISECWKSLDIPAYAELMRGHGYAMLSIGTRNWLPTTEAVRAHQQVMASLGDFVFVKMSLLTPSEAVSAQSLRVIVSSSFHSPVGRGSHKSRNR